MAQTIKIKRSSTSVAPTSLAEGELAYTHVPLTAQQIADGVEDTAGKLLIGRPGDATQLDPIGGKYYIGRSETAYGWGDHSTAGYASQTYVDNSFVPVIDAASAVYKSPVNSSTTDAWTSFEFTGYASTEGNDYYVFDVYAYEKPSIGGGFAHYTVYLNCKNSTGLPLTSNVIDVEVVGHNEINTDLQFYIERDLTGNKHKLWIKRDTVYSQATIVKSPVSTGSFSTVVGTSFATVTTDPVSGVPELVVRKAVLLGTNGTTSVTTNLGITGTLTASGNISTSAGNIVSGSSQHVKSGSAGFYVGSNQIVETSGANINVKGINDITLGGAIKGPADFIIDPAGYGNNTGKVTIAGDLVVTGITTSINSTVVELGDNVIRMNNALDTDTAVPSTLYSGLEISRGTSSDAYLLYREANDAGKKWVINEGGPSDVALLTSSNWDTAYTGAVDGGTF
jgi:hypothetical protein